MVLKITARQERIIDRINFARWARACEAQFEAMIPAEQGALATMLNLMKTTLSIEGASVDVPLLNEHSSADDIAEAFAFYVHLSSDEEQQWREAVEAANRPLNRDALLPPDLLTEDEKKDTR